MEYRGMKVTLGTGLNTEWLLNATIKSILYNIYYILIAYIIYKLLKV